MKSARSSTPPGWRRPVPAAGPAARQRSPARQQYLVPGKRARPKEQRQVSADAGNQKPGARSRDRSPMPVTISDDRRASEAASSASSLRAPGNGRCRSVRGNQETGDHIEQCTASVRRPVDSSRAAQVVQDHGQRQQGSECPSGCSAACFACSARCAGIVCLRRRHGGRPGDATAGVRRFARRRRRAPARHKTQYPVKLGCLSAGLPLWPSGVGLRPRRGTTANDAGYRVCNQSEVPPMPNTSLPGRLLCMGLLVGDAGSAALVRRSGRRQRGQQIHWRRPPGELVRWVQPAAARHSPWRQRRARVKLVFLGPGQAIPRQFAGCKPPAWAPTGSRAAGCASTRRRPHAHGLPDAGASGLKRTTCAAGQHRFTLDNGGHPVTPTFNLRAAATCWSSCGARIRPPLSGLATRRFSLFSPAAASVRQFGMSGRRYGALHVDFGRSSMSISSSCCSLLALCRRLAAFASPPRGRGAQDPVSSPPPRPTCTRRPAGTCLLDRRRLCARFPSVADLAARHDQFHP